MDCTEVNDRTSDTIESVNKMSVFFLLSCAHTHALEYPRMAETWPNEFMPGQIPFKHMVTMLDFQTRPQPLQYHTQKKKKVFQWMKKIWVLLEHNAFLQLGNWVQGSQLLHGAHQALLAPKPLALD